MNRILLLTVMVFSLIVSCKTGVEDRADDRCDLFKIGNYSFYNPRVYEYPVMFEKGEHDLLHSEYTPVWYSGYCAMNKPSFFETQEEFIKHIHSAKIERYGKAYFEEMYKKYKDDEGGVNGVNHEDFHLLFRGTVSVSHAASGNEYLLVAGKNYIKEESEYDKNTEFYESDVKDMFAFALEDDIYKSVDIDRVLGAFSKAQHDKVFDILNVKTLVNTVCFENVNTLKKPNFNSSDLPKWVYNKSELDE